VRRFWQGEEDEVGRLVHKPGGIERARWVFDYNADEDDDEAGIGSAAYRFLPGECGRPSRAVDGLDQIFRSRTQDMTAAIIRDVMVRLGGTSANDARLAAAVQIAAMFDGHITGLFFNIVRDELDGEAADQAAKSKDAARQAGDATETILFQRLTRLQVSTNLRRFDVTGDLDMSETALLAAHRRHLCSAPAERSVE
jgi:hypothetical protein